MEQPVKTVLGNGTQEWRLNGKYHRDDGPARIWSDGTKIWYQHGKYHRIDGPAAWIGANGTQVWYQHDKIHRVDGPARIWPNGAKEYYLQGIQLEEGSLTLKLIQERERRREASDGTAN